jgi:hypothetical protein
MIDVFVCGLSDIHPNQHDGRDLGATRVHVHVHVVCAGRTASN